MKKWKKIGVRLSYPDSTHTLGGNTIPWEVVMRHRKDVELEALGYHTDGSISGYRNCASY